MVLQINLTQGKVALVDDSDFEYLNQFRWCYSKKLGAVRHKDGKTCVIMHREIIGCDKRYIVKHYDENMLNNCRENLCVISVSDFRKENYVQSEKAHYRNWTNDAKNCYELQSDCNLCYIPKLKLETPCEMAKSVETLIKTLGKPPKTIKAYKV